MGCGPLFLQQHHTDGTEATAELTGLPLPAGEDNVLFLHAYLARAPPDDPPPAIPDRPPGLPTKISATHTAPIPRQASSSTGKA